MHTDWEQVKFYVSDMTVYVKILRNHRQNIRTSKFRKITMLL